MYIDIIIWPHHMLRVYAAYGDILDVIRSVVGVSVCVCVDHTEVQCKNG